MLTRLQKMNFLSELDIEKILRFCIALPLIRGKVIYSISFCLYYYYFHQNQRERPTERSHKQPNESESLTSGTTLASKKVERLKLYLLRIGCGAG